MKIVADCDIPYLRGALEPYGKVVYLKGKDIKASDLVDADALIVRTRTRCDAALLEGSHVRFVGTATIGYDHIDMDYCRRQGIRVATAAGCNARGVLQWVSAVLAGVSRREGWRPQERTVGVVGVGHVGSLIAAYTQSWGFRVLCCDPPRRRAAVSGNPATLPPAGTEFSDASELDPLNFVTSEEIAAQADIITFHVPLNRTGEDATFHLADSGFFGRIDTNSLIINSSRGEVVDTEALVSALQQSEQAGRKPGLRCAVDVWEEEPHIAPELLRRTLFATSHIAGYTLQGKINGTTMMVHALGDAFGLPVAGWYPPDAPPPVQPRPISWDEMCRTVGAHFDIDAETARLKALPGQFEQIRDRYDFRQEYF